MTLTIAPVRDEDPLELLAPWKPWRAHALADPRTAALARVAEGMLEIVAAEGPVVDHRVFHIYTKAAGLSRAAAPIVKRYRAALKRELDAGRLLCDGEVLRTPAQKAVHVRERGDRTLEEIPVDEIAALLRKLELDRGESRASDVERFRRVLEVWGLIRLTGKAKERMAAACAKANLPRWTNAVTSDFEPMGPPPKLAKGRKTIRKLRHG
jgi:hypothetical protein